MVGGWISEYYMMGKVQEPSSPKFNKLSQESTKQNNLSYLYFPVPHVPLLLFDQFIQMEK
jgi:hypothetical protein